MTTTEIILWAVIGVLTTYIVISAFVFRRVLSRALQLDEIVQQLSDDIITNLRQFAKMANGNMLSNEPEVQQAHHNMMIMARRLDEILMRMEEETGLKFRPKPPPERPTVV